MKSGSFRSTQWDPILLISQIVSLQFCVYFTLGILVFTANLLAGDNYRLDTIFEYHVSRQCVLKYCGAILTLPYVYRKFMSLT